MVGGWLVSGSVVRGFNKTQEKNMIEVVISPVTLVEFYFVILILIFFHIDDKKGTNLCQKQPLEFLTIPKDI